MFDDINYEVIDSDFEIIYIKEGILERKDSSFPCMWKGKYELKRALSSYFYFEVNRMNSSKKVVPGDAYVNGVKAECVGERGNYIIDKELVQEPLKIQITNVDGLLVRFLSFDHSDYVALEGEKVDIHVFDYDIREYYDKNFKAQYIFYKAGTKEKVELEEYEESISAGTPIIRFIMPPFDLDVEVNKVEDDNKVTISIDDSSIRKIDASNMFVGYNGIVTEAFYSDDYDFGVEDHHFYEGKMSFKKGTKVRVIVYLLKHKKLICIYNDKEYESYPYVENVQGKEIYKYEYKPLKINKSGTLSFKVKEE